MNENLNLVEILTNKGVPKGTRLWSPICGECTFQYIDLSIKLPIVCLAVDKYGQKTQVLFTKYGRMYSTFAYGECVLFPSKENRDWSTFKVSKKHKEFKPFQKVLRRTRDGNDNVIWTADFYSHYDESSMKHFLTSGYMANDSIIIPYEGNEDKLGKPVE